MSAQALLLTTLSLTLSFLGLLGILFFLLRFLPYNENYYLRMSLTLAVITTSFTNGILQSGAAEADWILGGFVFQLFTQCLFLAHRGQPCHVKDYLYFVFRHSIPQKREKGRQSLYPPSEFFPTWQDEVVDLVLTI